MAEESVARRYAQALLNQALASGSLDTISRDLAGVAETLAGSPLLAAYLNNPLVTRDRKKAMVSQLFTKESSPAALRFLTLLVEKRRIEMFESVKTEFDRLVRAHRGIVVASAVSAVPLSAPQLSQLQASLQARTGKSIELTTAVDPSLMGGVLVRIGDTVLDGTVKGKLERLREQLLVRK